jgi:hypothetical protein
MIVLRIEKLIRKARECLFIQKKKNCEMLSPTRRDEEEEKLS